MVTRKRKAFTLIELLVVLAIIAMIMALAVPAVSQMLNVTRIVAATDVLRAAVSRARSVAVSTRRSCTLDMSFTEDMGITEKLSTSVMLISDDFERYPEGVKRLDNLKDHWAMYPEPKKLDTKNIWQIVVGQTHELWTGKDSGKVDNAYAWSGHTSTPSVSGIDVERTLSGRFKIQRVNPDQQKGQWGFGLLAHFIKDRKQIVGYRFGVRAQTDPKTGLNVSSEAALQKIYSPSNPNSENCFDANTGDDKGVRSLDLPRLTALLAPGVWYRLKMDVKREDRIVKLAGKVWVDGSPEPEVMTVGPAYDAFSGADLPTGITDSFRQGGDALSGGFCGMWVMGGEVACDDFAVDSRENMLLPGGIHMQPVRPTQGAPRIDSDDFVPKDHLEIAKPYEPGGFPLSYRPDGTAAAERTILIRITDVASGNVRYVRIDPNTGRVDAADEL